jgi:hypothetical protein
VSSFLCSTPLPFPTHFYPELLLFTLPRRFTPLFLSDILCSTASFSVAQLPTWLIIVYRLPPCAEATSCFYLCFSSVGLPLLCTFLFAFVYVVCCSARFVFFAGGCARCLPSFRFFQAQSSQKVTKEEAQESKGCVGAHTHTHTPTISL